VLSLTFSVVHDRTLSDSVLTASSPPAATASLVSGTSNGSLTLNSDGSFDYVPAAAYVGADGFTFQINDGSGHTTTDSATINVTNNAPMAGFGTFSVLASGTTSIAPEVGVLANANDPDGDNLTAVLVSGPMNGTVSLHADGSFDFTPTGGFTGTDSFSYEVFDGVAYSAPATAMLTTAPVGTADAYQTGHDRTLSVDAASGVLANDVIASGDALTASLVSGTTNGSLTLNADGSFAYTPNAGFYGPDSFSYVATADGLSSSPVMVSLQVNETAPSVQGGSYFVNQDTTLTVAAADGVLSGASDTEGDAVTSGLLLPPMHGQLTLSSDGSFAYTPEAGFSGTDSFTVQVSDGLLSTPAVFSVQVNQRAQVAGASDLEALAVGDFNGDGRPDVALLDRSQGKVFIETDNGQGGYTLGSSYSVGNAPSAITAADFNGDGKLDLAVTNSGDGTVSVLLGNGDGTFTPSAAGTVQVGNAPSALVAVDLNGDGKLDLAVTNAGSGTVSLLLGNGDGSFTPSAAGPLTVGNTPSAITTADFNGDGRADLAVTNAADGTVTVLLNNGNGTFATTAYSVGSAPNSVVVGDFNGDGITDLAVANGGDGTISVLPGNGDGTFQNATSYTVGGSPASLVTGSFSGPSARDLAFIDLGTGTASVLRNQDGLYAPDAVSTLSGATRLAAFGGGANLPGLFGASGQQFVFYAPAPFPKPPRPVQLTDVTAVAVSGADGAQYAVYGTASGMLAVAGAARGTVLNRRWLRGAIQAVAINGDGSLVAVVTKRVDAQQQTVYSVTAYKVVNGEIGAQAYTIPDFTDPVNSIALSKTGDLAVSAGDDVHVYDTTGKETASASFFNGPAKVTFSPDGKSLAVGQTLVNRSVVVVAATATLKVLGSLFVTGAVTSVAFSAKGDRLAVGTVETNNNVTTATASVFSVIKGMPKLLLSTTAATGNNPNLNVLVAFDATGKNLVVAGKGVSFKSNELNKAGDRVTISRGTTQGQGQDITALAISAKNGVFFGSATGKSGPNYKARDEFLLDKIP
jgi:hypothetical protein